VAGVAHDWLRRLELARLETTFDSPCNAWKRRRKTGAETSYIIRFGVVCETLLAVGVVLVVGFLSVNPSPTR
jgi:hypothetical protein